MGLQPYRLTIVCGGQVEMSLLVQQPEQFRQGPGWLHARVTQFLPERCSDFIDESCFLSCAAIRPKRVEMPKTKPS